MGREIPTGFENIRVEMEKFTHPENREIFVGIKHELFTPKTAKDYRCLYHPSGRHTTAIASPKKEAGEEFYVEYFPEHPRNRVHIPFVEFGLPAIRVLRDDEKFPTRFGQLPSFVVDSEEKEFLITVSYYFSYMGYGVRREEIQEYTEEYETEEEKRQRWDEEDIKRLSYSVSGSDLRCVPLDDGDRRYIKELLNRYKADEFKEAEWMQDSSIK